MADTVATVLAAWEAPVTPALALEVPQAPREPALAIDRVPADRTELWLGGRV